MAFVTSTATRRYADYHIYDTAHGTSGATLSADGISNLGYVYFLVNVIGFYRESPGFITSLLCIARG